MAPPNPDDTGLGVSPIDTGPVAGQTPLVSPLLATKLFPPSVRPGLLDRPRLLERLDAGLRGKVTLLAAPAGSGKSTLLAAWRSSPTGQGRATAWVALDASDNDAARFWGYVITALDGIAPGIGARARALLHSPQPLPIAGVLTALLNDLTTLPNEAVLVLDDYHVIDAPAIHDALAFLIDHLPSTLRLVIVGRADPPLHLARLRARGDLTELRAVDLRCTADEAAAFLTETMGLGVTRTEAAALVERTEGWLAGLHLAGLALRDQPDPAGFVADFTGSHRYVLDYLTDEVLNIQTEPVRHFLLTTAILDRLCGSLCEALTGVADGQSTLEMLERANLFVVPLDSRRQWYRYHHLFADVLRQRLERDQPELVAVLHRRAAEWLEAAGLAEQSVHHFLAAGELDEAARVVEAIAEPLFLRSEVSVLLGWAERFPAATIHRRPRLGLGIAWALSLAGRHRDREPWLRGVEEALESASSPAAGDPQLSAEVVSDLQGQLAYFRAAATGYRPDPAAAVVAAQQAVARFPTTAGWMRAVALLQLGTAHLVNGDVAAADPILNETIEVSRAVGQLSTWLIAVNHLVAIRLAQGRLREADHLVQTAWREALERGAAPAVLAVLLAVPLGEVAYERNDLVAARRHLEAGATTGRAWSHPIQRIFNAMMLAQVCQAQGDDAGAAAAMQEATALAPRAMIWPGVAEHAAAIRARLWLAQGHLAEAADWGNAQTEPEPTSRHPFIYVDAVGSALARVRLAQGQVDAAERLLANRRRAAESAGLVGRVIEVIVLQALVRQARGRPAEAVAALGEAIALAEPEGWQRPFADEGAPLAAILQRGLAAGAWGNRAGDRLAAYARTLLAARDGERSTDSAAPPPTRPVPPKPGTAPLIEPISEREREVLQLVAVGRSNAEIARDLVVELSTVKTHLNNLYGKLGVHTRTQALARARDLGLLV